MKGIRNRGVAFKLFLLLFAGSFLVFFLVLANNYEISRGIVLESVQANASLLTQSTSNRIGMVLSTVETVVQSMSGLLERFSLEPDDLPRLVQGVVTDHPNLFGSAVALEPHAFAGTPDCFAPYAYRGSDGVHTMFLDCDTYHHPETDWYQIPKHLEQPVWSEPYFDEGGGDTLMATYSVPFHRTDQGQRRFAGIVTADIALDWLQDVVSSIRVEETGYGFLLSGNGTLITHPRRDLVMNETLFGVAEMLGDTRIRTVGRAMVRGESGFVRWKSIVTEEEGWLAFAPLGFGGWSLGVFLPEEELMEGASRLTRNVLFLGAGGFLALLGIVYLAAHSTTKPLRALARSTMDIAAGNLDAPLPRVRSGDEIGRLTRAFEHMTRALKEHIRRLTETTRAKERIESELHIARDIQMGILPKLFPPFPDEPQFDIHAVIVPAREVGGDFYDFYRVDADRICFAIGDVSGKGVPASLFMAVAKTLIKAVAAGGAGPAETLRRVNDELAVENESCMFVTVFLGMIDLRTGRVEYANGGHNPPLVLPRHGTISVPPRVAGALLGAMEGLRFETGSIALKPGDTLFLFTDGVTEAQNERLELFTDARLKSALTAVREKPLREKTARILDEVRAFAGAAEQADDITLLALTYYGEEGRDRESSPADAAPLPSERREHGRN